MKSYRILAWVLLATFILGVVVACYSVVTSNNQIVPFCLVLIVGSAIGTHYLKRAVAEEHEAERRRQQMEKKDDENDSSLT